MLRSYILDNILLLDFLLFLITIGFVLSFKKKWYGDSLDSTLVKKGNSDFLITLIAGFVSITTGLLVTNYSNQFADSINTKKMLDSIITEIAYVLERDSVNIESSASFYKEDANLLANALNKDFFIKNITKESYLGLIKEHGNLEKCNYDIETIIEHNELLGKNNSTDQANKYEEDIQSKLEEKKFVAYKIVKCCSLEKDYIDSHSEDIMGLVKEVLGNRITSFDGSTNENRMTANKEKELYEILSSYSEYYKTKYESYESENDARPKVNIGKPSTKRVKQGEEVRYEVTFEKADIIDFKTDDIGIVGGTGVHLTKSFEEKDNKIIVTLKNITGPYNQLVGIGIKAGVAKNSYGESAQTENSVGFRLEN